MSRSLSRINKAITTKRDQKSIARRRKVDRLKRINQEYQQARMDLIQVDHVVMNFCDNGVTKPKCGICPICSADKLSITIKMPDDQIVNENASA